MNSTTTSFATGYGPTEKVVLSLLGGVLVPLTGWIVFVVARRRLRLQDTLQNRGYLFHQILAGVLLGQFMCHTWVGLGATPLDARFMFLFALFGYNVTHLAETLGRLWNTNENYEGPANDDNFDEEYSLDRTHLEEQTVVITSNVGSADFAEQHWRNRDYTKQMRKRSWMLVLVIVVFAIISVMDGLLLVYRNPQGETQVTLTIFAFYLNGYSMTVSVYGAALHAKWHITEERRWVWWSGLCLVWGAILLGSVVPVLANVSTQAAQSIISNMAFLAFYGIASGCVLRLTQYYGNHKARDISRSDALVGELVFWLATAQAAVTGFWL